MQATEVWTHRCTAACPASCFPWLTTPRDPYHAMRLPRGWHASRFIGPYLPLGVTP